MKITTLTILLAAVMLAGCTTIRERWDRQVDRWTRTPDDPATPGEPSKPPVDTSDHPARWVTQWWGGVNMSQSRVDPDYRLTVSADGRQWSGAPASWISGRAGPGSGHDAVGCCAAAYQRADGSWAGGKYEWHVRPPRPRDWKNIRNGYGGWVAPPSGTPIWVWVHTADGNRVSTAVQLRWP